MSLRKSESTLWLFLLGANCGRVEERFVYDVAYGIKSLEKSGVRSSEIRVLVDTSGQELVKNTLARAGTNDDYRVAEVSKLNEILHEDPHYTAAVIFVTGHGSPEFLVADNPIKPYKFISLIKESATLKRCILYLGQCFAGIFNYLSVGRTQVEKDTDTGCEIVVIGATNLSPSISAPTSETFGPEKIPWQANIFLLGLFVWIANPVDVDGDGKCTIMDSYKFAGSYVNQVLAGRNENIFPEQLSKLIESKNSLKKTLKQTHDEFEALSNKRQIPPSLLKKLLDASSMAEEIKALQGQISHFLNRQETWILNARPAQEIEF